SESSLGRMPPSIPRQPFTARQLDAVPPPEGYAAVVADIVRRMGPGLRKVVLARTIEVDAGRELDPRRLAHRLRAVNPDAFTFATPTTAGILVGASPELLVSRFGREVRSNPLAGSAARTRGRWGGWTRAVMADGRSPCGALSSAGIGRRSTRAPASWRAASRMPRSTRRNASSAPSSTRSGGADLSRDALAVDRARAP